MKLFLPYINSSWERKPYFISCYFWIWTNSLCKHVVISTTPVPIFNHLNIFKFSFICCMWITWIARLAYSIIILIPITINFLYIRIITCHVKVVFDITICCFHVCYETYDIDIIILISTMCTLFIWQTVKGLPSLCCIFISRGNTHQAISPSGLRDSYLKLRCNC